MGVEGTQQLQIKVPGSMECVTKKVRVCAIDDKLSGSYRVTFEISIGKDKG